MTPDIAAWLHPFVTASTTTWFDPLADPIMTAFVGAFPHLAAIAPLELHRAAAQLQHQGHLLQSATQVERTVWRCPPYLPDSQGRIVYVQVDRRGHPTDLVARTTYRDHVADHWYSAALLHSTGSTVTVWRQAPLPPGTLPTRVSAYTNPIRYWAAADFAVALAGPHARLAGPPDCAYTIAVSPPTAWCDTCGRFWNRHHTCSHLYWCAEQQITLSPDRAAQVGCRPACAAARACTHWSGGRRLVPNPAPSTGVAPFALLNDLVHARPHIRAWVLAQAQQRPNHAIVLTSRPLHAAFCTDWPQYAQWAARLLRAAAESLLHDGMFVQRSGSPGKPRFHLAPSYDGMPLVFVAYDPVGQPHLAVVEHSRDPHTNTALAWYVPDAHGHLCLHHTSAPQSITVDAGTTYWAAPHLSVQAAAPTTVLLAPPGDLQLCSTKGNQ